MSNFTGINWVISHRYHSVNCDVPPQASCILQLVKYIQKLQQKNVEVAEEVTALFAGELNPVAPKAQKKVPIPEGWAFLECIARQSTGKDLTTVVFPPSVWIWTPGSMSLHQRASPRTRSPKRCLLKKNPNIPDQDTLRWTRKSWPG